MAIAATSCTRFGLLPVNADDSQTFRRSGRAIPLSPSSRSAYLNLLPYQASGLKHYDSCTFLLRSSELCGGRISHPRASSHRRTHLCSPITCHLGRDSSSSRRVSHGLGANERQWQFLNTAVEIRPRTDRGAAMVCRGAAAAAVAEIVTLKPFLDKLVLFGTVMYYYITGVSAVPRLPELASAGKRISSAPKLSAPIQKPVNKKPVQRQRKARQQVSSAETWLALDTKLFRALSLDESESIEIEEQHSPNPVLSLQAFARGPREYLLYTTLQHLRKEVESITEADQELGLSQWRDLSLSVLCRAVLPVCTNWVSQDLTVMNSDVANGVTAAGLSTAGENMSLTETRVLDSMTDFLRDTESIKTYLTKSGKADLYADLIFFLRFGSIRTGGCCDYRSFSRFAGKALEDMVVVVAEVVATLFLDSCSSVATLSPQSETWQAFLLPSILSTRSLERFRNEVALNGWLNLNFTSVVAMFEDRFDLWTFQRRPIPSVDKNQVKDTSSGNGEKEVKRACLRLTRLQLPARRSDELKALTGWRYYYSLYLEFSDVVGPILGMLLTRLGEAVSFLLVRLIGRSLGLVYQGIRQSVRWSPK
ncbi:hypothetical protein Mapa_007900 [Marchantia paleacea]|nr:hypothetical protein Mapa_007900 [Marchantia paleacea]